MAEIAALDGTLTWDGSVLELFSVHGHGHSWRVLARTVTDWRLERRKDRLHLELDLSKRFYEVIQVPLDAEAEVRAVLGEVDRARGAA